MKKPKMVIVMRTDLGMGTGKMIAQAGHAVTQLILDNAYTYEHGSVFEAWIQDGMKKVTLAVDSEQALLDIQQKAKEKFVKCYLITDAGLTQNEPGTKTCLALGPAKDKQMEKVTGSLKLLD